MKISRRLLLLFAGSVLLPSLILAYLSFRSVKTENVLIEQSLEERDQSFVDAVSQTLRKTRQSQLENLRERLHQGGSAETPEAAWSLAASLLETPVVQSVAIFHNDSAVFPRAFDMPASPASSLSSPSSASSAETVSVARSTFRSALAVTVRKEWSAKHYSLCLRTLHLLLHGPDSLAFNPGTASFRFGFQLLEIKCLVNLGETGEALATARRFIRDLSETDALDSYHQIAFYLNETVNLMTSMENLPHGARDELMALHQRLPLFLTNAERVTREWPALPEDILRVQSESPPDSLLIQYQQGAPYLLVGSPWLAHGTQALLRLDENVFVEALRSELAPEKRSAWKDVDFSILNLHDEPMLASLASESPADREPALERSFEGAFPAWRVIVYKKPASELISLGHRRIAQQYTLLGFSLLALLLGTIALFGGLEKEQHTVQMKSNFLSAVSHELKTPLTAIRMFAEILASGRQPQEEKRQQYLHRIGEEAERLQGMIEGILSYTRLEENPGALSLTDVDLSAVAAETALLLSGAFAKASIQLSTRLAPTAPLRADYDSMRSVIQNLLENSLKYSQPKTEVVLEVRDLPDEVTLRVADHGIGIPAADQKRIFERFYRAGDEMTRKTRGSGIGLALVKRIVDFHGGTIHVNSKVNEGTEMTITFPKNLPNERGAHA